MTVHKGAMRVVGIDPGPVVGIVGLRVPFDTPPWTVGHLDIIQCDPGSLESILGGLFLSYRFATALAVEAFVVGPRAARSTTPAAGRVTREVIGVCGRWADRNGIGRIERSAAEVKPWATDTRLDAAGLLVPTKGMRHARDAARHALFHAVKTYGMLDPLSIRAGAA